MKIKFLIQWFVLTIDDLYINGWTVLQSQRIIGCTLIMQLSCVVEFIQKDHPVGRCAEINEFRSIFDHEGGCWVPFRCTLQPNVAFVYDEIIGSVVCEGNVSWRVYMTSK